MREEGTVHQVADVRQIGGTADIQSGQCLALAELGQGFHLRSADVEISECDELIQSSQG